MAVCTQENTQMLFLNKNEIILYTLFCNLFLTLNTAETSVYVKNILHHYFQCQDG